MMIPIKFRVWNPITKRMYYYDPASGTEFNSTKIASRPYTMVFTGIKDSTGKDIYECDILQSPKNKKLTKIVEWKRAECRWNIKLPRWQEIHFTQKHSWKIIGDVFNNNNLVIQMALDEETR